MTMADLFRGVFSVASGLAGGALLLLALVFALNTFLGLFWDSRGPLTERLKVSLGLFAVYGFLGLVAVSLFYGAVDGPSAWDDTLFWLSAVAGAFFSGRWIAGVTAPP